MTQLTIADQIRIKSSNVYCPPPIHPRKNNFIASVGVHILSRLVHNRYSIIIRLAGMDVNATYCSKNSFIKVTDFFSVMTNTVSKMPPIFKMLWVAGISEGGGGWRDPALNGRSRIMRMKQHSVSSIYLHPSLNFGVPCSSVSMLKRWKNSSTSQYMVMEYNGFGIVMILTSSA